MPWLCFDHVLVEPPPIQLQQNLGEALSKANGKSTKRIVSFSPEAIHHVLREVTESTEGTRLWRGSEEPKFPASILALAWCTDGLGRKHCRIASTRATNRTELNDPLELPEGFPPLGVIYPERVVWWTTQEQRELCAICACGNLGPVEATGWTENDCQDCRHKKRHGRLLSPFLGSRYCWAGFAPDQRTLVARLPGHARRENGYKFLAALDCGRRRLQGELTSNDESIIRPPFVFSPDASLLAGGMGTRELRLWDLATHERRVCLPVQSDIGAIALSSDKETAALAHHNKTISLWHVWTGTRIKSWQCELSYYSLSLLFSPDGRYLAMQTPDEVRVWEVPSGKKCLTLPGHSYSSDVHPAFTADSTSLLAALGTAKMNKRGNTRVALWDLSTRKENTLLEVPGFVQKVQLSPDENLIALSIFAGKPAVRLFRRSGETVLHRDTATDSFTQEFVFSSDSRWLARTRWRTVTVWNTTTGEEMASLEWVRRCIRALTFAPDNKTILLATSTAEIGVPDPKRVLYLTRWDWRRRMKDERGPRSRKR